ncbi:hypothetical protein N7467_012341 [Penicillium canescens]|nr:hypothetical protein N7467_012341 [Penicillium canescens]
MAVLLMLRHDEKRRAVQNLDQSRRHQDRPSKVDHSRQRFDLPTLQSKLCDVARDLLCARWNRQRQADQVGQQWYEAAVRNQARVPYDPRIASQSVVVYPGQRQTFSASRQRPASDNTDPSRHRLRQDPSVSLLTNPEPVQPSTPFVTATMLRTNSVPWSISQSQPAILSSATNIWASVQDLTLQSLTPSEEVDSIHCVFCLTGDEDHADERVILRCHHCRALSHLTCAKEWLERRDTGSGMSCLLMKGALDALIRPLRIPLSDAETNSVLTASETSPDGGTRRSGAYLPRYLATSAPLRQSARLNSTQRG